VVLTKASINTINEKPFSVNHGGIEVRRLICITIALILALPGFAFNSIGEEEPTYGPELVVESVEYAKGYMGPIEESDWYFVNFVVHFRHFEWESDDKYYRRTPELGIYYSVPTSLNPQKSEDEEQYGPRLYLNYRTTDTVCDGPYDYTGNPNGTSPFRCEWGYKQTVGSMELKNVVEFQDRDGDGAFYPKSSDLTLKRVKARDVNWSIPEVTALDSEDNEVALSYELHVHQDGSELLFGEVSEDDIDSGAINGFRVTMGTVGPPSMELISHYFLSHHTFSGINMTSTETELKLHISSFPFESEHSSLALAFSIWSHDLFDAGSDEDNWLGVEYQEEKGNVNFYWSSTAEVDSSPILANIYTHAYYWNVQGPPSGTFISFSYPQGDEIFHDPILGVVERPPLPGNWGSDESSPVSLTTILGLTVGIVALGVVLTVIAYSRRNDVE
jgi:hypothetical protein